MSYIRRNMVAFVALFIAIVSFGGTAAYAANTIRSSDIVDGQVKNQDLADNAVGTKKIQDGSVLGADIKDNSLGGADIKESTLGEVPNAARVAGLSGAVLRHTADTQVNETDRCIQPGLWEACSDFSLTVPAGHAYNVTVISSVTANPGATSGEIAFCPATGGPTCINPYPEVVTLPANSYTNASTSNSVVLGPGRYDLTTAVKDLAPLLATVFANTATTISYYDTQVTLNGH